MDALPDFSPKSTHISDDHENPCARIYCRGRRIIPTLCDGTCIGCRKEREKYISEAVITLQTRLNANPAAGTSIEHEFTPISLLEAEEQVRDKVLALDARKVQYIQAALAVIERTSAYI